MKVGFTGTQIGMSPRQKEILTSMLGHFLPTEFHHGDCIGADAEAHDIASELGLMVVIHPPTNPDKRAFKQSAQIKEPRAYLSRNHEIVDMTDVLIVAPKTDKEELRSGTWATYRYALSCNKNVVLLAR